MPKRPKQIEDVSKTTMVDLRAALYQSEETLKQQDGATVREEQKRREKRKGDGLGMKNKGVAGREAADLAYERDENTRVEESLRRKAAAYEALMAGDSSAVPDHSLVDFELKQLECDRMVPREREGDDRNTQRANWEAAARQEMAEDVILEGGSGPSGAKQRYEQRSSDTEKRDLEEVISGS